MATAHRAFVDKIDGRIYRVRPGDRFPDDAPVVAANRSSFTADGGPSRRQVETATAEPGETKQTARKTKGKAKKPDGDEG